MKSIQEIKDQRNEDNDDYQSNHDAILAVFDQK